MSTRAASAPRSSFQIPGTAIGVVIIVLGSAFGIAAFMVLGAAAILIPVFALIIALAIAFPKTFVYLLLGTAITLEPGAIDFTRPLATNLWELPTNLKDLIPLTLSPMEIGLLAAALSLFLRGRTRTDAPPLPRIIWAVPVVMLMGFAYGAHTGADLPLAYNESRGLLFAMVIFFIVMRMGTDSGRGMRIVLFTSSTLLALVTINRWAFYTRSGDSPVPIEFAFAHENAVLFGIAVVISGMYMLRAKSNGTRIALILHMLLLLAATFVTGRRAGTLVLLVGGMTVAGLLFPKRPIAVLIVSIPVLIVGVAYLGAYWNKEYGALAQPARAIRSQIDPSTRDASSDDYRVIERFNVTETLKLNKVFGIGFGRPFAQFQPLPDLTAFWPTQDYTPHQNVLWLWLKMGILGVSVMLGVWLVALKRCFEVIRSTPKSAPLPITPVVLATTLLMYLSYAQIDQALTGTRGIGALAVAIALCFRLKPWLPPAEPVSVAPEAQK